MILIYLPKRFTIPERMRKAFKQGLIKATESTDSIIFTNANNKLVGEAVEEYTFYNKINIIGICAWKTVAFREQLIVRELELFY